MLVWQLLASIARWRNFYLLEQGHQYPVNHVKNEKWKNRTPMCDGILQEMGSSGLHWRRWLFSYRPSRRKHKWQKYRLCPQQMWNKPRLEADESPCYVWRQSNIEWLRRPPGCTLLRLHRCPREVGWHAGQSSTAAISIEGNTNPSILFGINVRVVIIAMSDSKEVLVLHSKKWRAKST